METVQITRENENKIADKYKTFDCWVYDHILLKHKEAKPVIRIHFKNLNDHGVFLCNKFGNEYCSRIAFSNEEMIDINILNEYFKKTIQIAKDKTCCLNIYSNNKNIIKYFHSKYKFNIDFKGFELRITRAKYSHLYIENQELEKQNYNKDCLTEYLALLDESFDPITPGSHCFTDNKEYYSEQFTLCNENNSFTAFWLKDELIGLYYISDRNYIHTIAIHPRFQYRGFGKAILKRAIDDIINKHGDDECRLKVTDNNKRALEFYKKNKFDIVGHCVEATLQK
jgi:GNAT superfamily N-acetyltransferase